MTLCHPLANGALPEEIDAAVTRLLVGRSVGDTEAVHVDVGGRDPQASIRVATALGRQCVAVVDETVSAAFAEQGVETHRLVVGDEAAVAEGLNGALAGREIASVRIASLSATSDAQLAAVVAAARRGDAPVVVVAGNAARADLGIRLAFGRAGEGTAIGCDGETVARRLAAAGLAEIDAADVVRSIEDLALDPDHPALAAGTLLHGLLAGMRRRVDAHADTLVFVRVCAATACQPVAAEDAVRPFLSAIVRTQGRRLHTLTETLLGMTAQSDGDFEVLVVGHRVPDDLRPGIEQTVADLPEGMRAKVRTIWVETGTRTRPLNDGFAAARGRYIAILDDDDVPMAHWVETFRKLDRRHPGRVLRATVVRQDVDTVAVAGRPGLRAEGGLERCYPADFDLVAHFSENYTPPVSVAFPRGTFHDLAIRFDETLTTVEDWDFLMRTIAVVGVVASPEITSIYRWWSRGESSRKTHSQDEWRRNRQRVVGALDETVFLLPKGSVSALGSGWSVGSAGSAAPTGKGLLEAALADRARYRGKRRSGLKAVLFRLRQTARSALLRIRHRKRIRKIEASAFFNPVWYAYIYPDVVHSGLDPAVHYVTVGAREGRDPGPFFSAAAYRTANPELAARGADALIHYLDHGSREGRPIHPSRLTGAV